MNDKYSASLRVLELCWAYNLIRDKKVKHPKESHEKAAITKLKDRSFFFESHQQNIFNLNIIDYFYRMESFIC